MEYKNEHITELENAAHEVSLSLAERSEIKRNLVTFMKEHPVRQGIFARLLSYEIMAFRFHPIAFALVLLLSSGAGTAFAAEGALPDEILYPVKVSINEPLRKIASRTPEARRAVAQAHAERRLEEAELLAARGTLTHDVQKEIAARLAAHVADFETNESSTKESSFVVNADFEAALAAHADVLETIADETGDVALEPVVAIVREKAERFARKHEEKQKEIVQRDDVKEVVLARKDRAEKKIALARGNKDSLEPKAQMHVAKVAVEDASSMMFAGEMMLHDPEDDFSRGESDLERGEYSPALKAFDEAAKKAERARVRNEREEKVRPILAKRGIRLKKEHYENKSKEIEIAPETTALPTPSTASAIEEVSALTAVSVEFDLAATSTSATSSYPQSTSTREN